MKINKIFIGMLIVATMLVTSIGVFADDTATTGTDQTIKTEPTDTVMQRYQSELSGLAQRVTDGKMTQDQADQMTTTINQEIKDLQDFEALTDVQSKRDKLISDYTAQVNQRVQDGKMTQDDANTAIADYTAKINAWDGTDYPVIYGGRSGGNGNQSGGSGWSGQKNRGDAYKDAVVLIVGKCFALNKGSKVQIDSADASIMPIVISGNTLVPLAFVGQTFGADVTWNAATKQVEVKTSDKTATLTIGSNIMTVNDQPITLNTSVQIRNGRTLIPLRAIVENVLDKKVTYNNGVIYITDDVATLGTDDVNTLNNILK